VKKKGASKDTGLRRRAEERLKGEKREAGPLPAEQNARRMVHELEVQQIELEMQNEELEQARKEIEKQLEKYTDLYNFAPVGYFTLDRAGTIREANLTGARLLGIEWSGLVGRRLGSFLCDESHRSFAECLREIYEGTVGPNCELALLAPGDGPRYVHIEGTPVASDGVASGQCRVVMIDITERKRAEAMARRLESFPELNPNPILEVNASGEVIFCNPVTLAVLARIGMNEGDCSAFVPKDLQGILAAWDRRTEEMLNREVPIGDRVFDEAIHLVPQFNVARIYGRDITERKKADETLKKAHGELEKRVQERTSELTKAYESLRIEAEERQRTEAELRRAHKLEAVGTLAGGIAHDFNNILAAILGFSELARDESPEDSPVRSHLERIFAAGIRGRDLVKQILVFSRRAEPETHPLKLAPVIKETLKLLRASLPSTINIRASLQGETGFVLADPTQMQQVIMNLCTNAAYAMRQKGGRISIELTHFSFSSPDNAPDPTMSPGLYTKLSVKDAGEGIPPETIEHIFNPFFTTKAAGEGTGLGLSVVHGIVASHGGTITVSSEPDKGSTFTIYLPTLIEDQSRDPGDVDKSIPGGCERILFIDDEEDLVTMGDATLTGLGYRVTSRTGAGEALALFKLDPSRFDLVISDQTMPEMTGVDLAKEILSIRPDMPIILCTGFSHLVDADSAQTVGIKAFAMKPLTKREIARTIRKVLDE
jgi:PAS domain S-box-containing protein